MEGIPVFTGDSPTPFSPSHRAPSTNQPPLVPRELLTFAALNTMYAAVGTRAREIATLRAIGFGGVPVIASVIVESMMLALLGGLLGGAVAAGTHLSKAGGRALINVSPEPFSNWVASFSEEAMLLSTLPGYAEYRSKTWKLLPPLY